MQIVIDVPEELYDRFRYEYREENLISKSTNDAILEVFCKGRSLPKGYSADELTKNIIWFKER